MLLNRRSIWTKAANIDIWKSNSGLIADGSLSWKPIQRCGKISCKNSESPILFLVKLSKNPCRKFSSFLSYHIWNLIWSDDEVFLLILIDLSEFRQQLFCACKHPLLFGSGWILISKPTISVAFVVTSTVNRRISLSLLWLTVWNLFARFKTSWWAFQLTGIVGLGANFNAFVKLS